MYKNSKNKSKILASIQNPINSELVEQLKSYIDIPESDTSEESDRRVLQDISVRTSEDSESITPDEVDKDSEDGADIPTSEESKTEDTAIESDTDTEATVKSVEESTTVVGKPIVGQTVLYSENKCVAYTSIDDVVWELKGALNLKDDTSGVSRVQVKQNELWIYYDDSINLNSVMNPVLDYLNAASYTYLEFNRLARSDNAIVFEISFIDTDNIVKPIGSVHEK